MSQASSIGFKLDLVDLLVRLVGWWRRPEGLILVIVAECVFVMIFHDELRVLCSSTWVEIVVSGCVLFATIIVWLLRSKRLLFRNTVLAIVVFLVAILISFCFYSILYGEWIDDTKLDLPYVRYWGALLIFILVFLCGISFNLFVRSNRLFVVFAVANGSVELESKLKPSIENVLHEIEDQVSSVRLELLPFGAVDSAKKAALFIRRPFTSADAVVFATLIEDTEGGHVEYLFDKFTSRINERRFLDAEQSNRIDEGIVIAHNRSKTWNSINKANDNCTRAKVVFDNLRGMLEMYVGGILLMKHCFKDALPFMEMSLSRESSNFDTYTLASQLYTYAVLSSVKVLESKQQDYKSAFNQLSRCASKLPASVSHPGYNMAMARAMFYKNDIAASKEYTKTFKNTKGCEWEYELNMGFYAIYGKCVPEFVRRYKRLLRYNVRDKEGLDFAIDFLQRQIKCTNDQKYSLLLKVAIAFLYMYKKRSKAKTLINRVDFSSLPPYEVKELNKLVVCIDSSLQLSSKRYKK